jgi:hypothetical protein
MVILDLIKDHVNIFDRFLRKNKPETKADPKPKKVEKTAKELATEKGEPYFDIISIEIDPKDINNGSFEFDWNEIFINRLVKAGYMMGPKDTDVDIIDRWYTNVCRNVVLETYEQHEAMDPERDRVVKTRNIGGGRTEVS